MIAALLQDGEWSREELGALKAEIDRIGREKKSS
jgi:hypothetical protein